MKTHPGLQKKTKHNIIKYSCFLFAELFQVVGSQDLWKHVLNDTHLTNKSSL